MAAKTRKLNIRFSPEAWAAIDQIWDWNADNYSPDHADRYVAFLLGQIQKLATGYGRGRTVPTRSRWRYVAIMQRQKRHGRVAVYEVLGDDVLILDLFHTAQDWQTGLRGRH